MSIYDWNIIDEEVLFLDDFSLDDECYSFNEMKKILEKDMYLIFANFQLTESGKGITDNTHIGIINPFRYRSYYYDNETGYYYLNSRYYNPEWGRFINADGIIGTSSNIDTYNLYSYVENNFVNKIDVGGNCAIPLVYAGYWAVGVVATYAVAYMAPSAVRTSVAVAGSIIEALDDALTKNSSNKNDDKKENCVYKLYDSKKGEYIGRTNDLDRREREHHMNKYRSHLTFEEIKCYPTKEEARINEQIYIEKYKTLNRNKENPINNQINDVNPNSSFYRDKVIPYRQGLYYSETFVGGNE